MTVRAVTPRVVAISGHVQVHVDSDLIHCAGWECDVTFPRPNLKGRAPKWCSNACRKRTQYRDKYAAPTCPECGAATRSRLCPACERAQATAAACRTTDAGLLMPISDGDETAWALVDVDDRHVTLACWHRSNHGYVCRRTRDHEEPADRILLLHRVIMGLDHGDPLQVDHINGDPLDNRRQNLRIATATENGQNVPSQKGTSRFRGVSLNRRTGRWVANVSTGGKTIHLGTFDDEEAAARAAAAKRAEIFTHSNEARGGWPFPPSDSDAVNFDADQDDRAIGNPMDPEWPDKPLRLKAHNQASHERPARTALRADLIHGPGTCEGGRYAQDPGPQSSARDSLPRAGTSSTQVGGDPLDEQPPVPGDELLSFVAGRPGTTDDLRPTGRHRSAP